MVSSLGRLHYAWRRHGPAGFIRLAAYNIAVFVRNRGRETPSSADLFDEKYGTDTGGIREVGSLDILDLAVARSAKRYEPSGGQMVQAALVRLAIDYREYSFIDFGSGKGRVLMVAAGFPFKSVIGVEFSRELHEVAARNIAALPAQAVRAGAIETVHGDAGAFHPPHHNLVCYLYNPFGPPVIAEVARRLASHPDDHGGRVIVIYADPRHRAVFEETGKFTILDERPQVLTMATPPPDGAGAGDRH
jgi:SAM-dependent methyltransferase